MEQRKVYRVNLISDRPKLTMPTLAINNKLRENEVSLPPELSLKLNNEQWRVLQDLHREAIEKLPELIIYESLISIIDQKELAKLDIEVTSPELKGPATIDDPRLGAGYDTTCSTCNLSYALCPGHFGKIRLPFPIYHPMYMRMLIKVLNIICTNCAKPVIDIDQVSSERVYETSGTNRLMMLEKLVLKECPYCRTTKISFMVNASLTSHQLVYSKGKDKVQAYPIEEVSVILNAIEKDTWKLLGFNPETPPSFILYYIPVLPKQDRPCVEDDKGVHQDDLTILYSFLLNAINSYNTKKNSKDPNRDIILNDLANNINNLVKSIIDNTDGSIHQGNRRDRPLITIKQRLQGKEGYIRGATMGKRTNFTARTVISPDPTLRFGQVRIPKIFESSLTQSVMVTNLNIAELTTLLRAGKITAILFGSGERKNQIVRINQYNKDFYTLHVGDRVNRYLQNGDYVIINRQPTLHKYGMLAHEVVLGPQLTIGLHPSVTTPFNADFDGDEMNVHAIQNPEALVETKLLLNVKHCVMNVQNNKPVLGAVYDALSASYLLTQEGTWVSWTLFLDIFLALDNPPAIDEFLPRAKKYKANEIIDNEKVSGRILFSLLFPADFFYIKDKVVIVEGILLSGVITKDYIGTSHGSIVQVLWKNYGVDKTADFLTNIGWLTNRWLDTNPLSVTLYDCLPQDTTLRNKIEEEVDKVRLAVESYGVRFNDPIEEYRKEQEIIAHLQSVRNNATNLSFAAISPENTLRVMTLSGAKGSKVNVVQIMGILAQQFLRNQRIPIGLGDGFRCLPWFSQDSLDPMTRGFCVNSFINGLSPAEFFFHQTASREGLLDIAMKTPETGDINHRIAKALEDIMVTYDGSVRNPAGNIFQLVYGEDGFNAEELENFPSIYGRQTFFVNIERLVNSLNAKYGYTNITSGEIEERDVEDIEQEIKDFPDEEDYDEDY